jgi:hypothetical protein
MRTEPEAVQHERELQMTGFCRKMSMQTGSSVSLAGNLVKPLISLYGTEWRESGCGHRENLNFFSFFYQNIEEKCTEQFAPHRLIAK